MEKYKKIIKKDEEKLKNRLLKKGNYENFGEAEYRSFREKVNADREIHYSEMAQLCADYSEMVRNIQ